MSLFLAIVGSRTYPQLSRVAAAIDFCLAELGPDLAIVSGGARGVDQAAERAARERGLRVISYRPVQVAGGFRVHRFDSSLCPTVPPVDSGFLFRNFAQAALTRNGYIVRRAHGVIAFPIAHGSRGTADSIAKARALDRPLLVVPPR